MKHLLLKLQNDFKNTQKFLRMFDESPFLDSKMILKKSNYNK